MVKGPGEQVGLVYVRDMGGDVWKFSWWDDARQKHVRKQVRCKTKKDAMAQAKEYNVQIASGKPQYKQEEHTITDALEEWMENSDSIERTRKTYKCYCGQFVDWMIKERPGIVRWSRLTPKVINDYLRYLEERKLSYDAVRMGFHVIRATGHYLCGTYPDQYTANPAATIRLHRQTAVRPRVNLPTAEDVLVLIEYARACRKQDLLTILSLQAMAGLRIYEATNLREQDIDPKAKTITIAKTSKHTPKTLSSARTIPVSKSLIDLLEEQIKTHKVRHPEGFAILTRGSKPWSPDGISLALNRLISGVSLKAFNGIPARKLRSVFVTLARGARADARVLQAYIGHAAADVLGAHYESISMDWMQSEIVDKVENVYTQAESQVLQKYCNTKEEVA